MRIVHRDTDGKLNVSELPCTRSERNEVSRWSRNGHLHRNALVGNNDDGLRLLRTGLPFVTNNAC